MRKIFSLLLATIALLTIPTLSTPSKSLRSNNNQELSLQYTIKYITCNSIQSPQIYTNPSMNACISSIVSAFMIPEKVLLLINTELPAENITSILLNPLYATLPQNQLASLRIENTSDILTDLQHPNNASLFLIFYTKTQSSTNSFIYTQDQLETLLQALALDDLAAPEAFEFPEIMRSDAMLLLIVGVLVVVLLGGLAFYVKKYRTKKGEYGAQTDEKAPKATKAASNGGKKKAAEEHDDTHAIEGIQFRDGSIFSGPDTGTQRSVKNNLNNSKGPLRLQSNKKLEKGIPGETTSGLKLEDNVNMSADHDNIFQGIDNSPRSLNDVDGTQSSARETPKNVDFKIEFSMIENDTSKLRSVRNRDQIIENDDN